MEYTDKDFAKRVRNRRKHRKTAIIIILILAFIMIGGVAYTKLTGSLPFSGHGEAIVTVECKSVAKDTSVLKDDALKKYIPQDGYVINDVRVKLNKNDNAFEVTKRALNSKKIHMESKYDSLFQSNYVKGINYLYEKDAGPNSGWMFTVNGRAPKYGANKIGVKKGDKVVWSYTVDYTKNGM